MGMAQVKHMSDHVRLEDFSAKELLDALHEKLFSSVGGPPWEDAICALYHHECWNCPAQNERERCIKDEWESYLSGIREQFERHPEPKVK